VLYFLHLFSFHYFFLLIQYLSPYLSQYISHRFDDFFTDAGVFVRAEETVFKGYHLAVFEEIFSFELLAVCASSGNGLRV